MKAQLIELLTDVLNGKPDAPEVAQRLAGIIAEASPEDVHEGQSAEYWYNKLCEVLEERNQARAERYQYKEAMQTANVGRNNLSKTIDQLREDVKNYREELNKCVPGEFYDEALEKIKEGEKQLADIQNANEHLRKMLEQRGPMLRDLRSIRSKVYSFREVPSFGNNYGDTMHPNPSVVYGINNTVDELLDLLDNEINKYQTPQKANANS